MAKKSEPRFIKLPVDVIEFPDYNPREISKKEFNKLRKDIRSDPHFLIQRPPLINHITAENKYVCYAGNQRYIKLCEKSDKAAIVKINGVNVSLSTGQELSKTV